ncbi:ATP-binding protein [Actinocorallia longicatena]|uniref:Histidine kinase/HSP90-like ATPase domain-containing protein n=1 Tax=Actinocorallia longicatena TaxID=111803 RepID=A0ABP6QMI6_9ACTN
MHSEKTLRAAPLTEAVEQARRLTVSSMRSWALSAAEEPVTAIVAELVANAVRHAATPLELRLMLLDDRVRVEVRDRDHRMPVLGKPQALDDGGRGLFLVDAYSAAWGAERSPDGGKTVWAEITIPVSGRPRTSQRP